MSFSLWLSLLACGPSSSEHITPGTTAGAETRTRAGEARVELVSRPTDGYVLIQLWIDAGSRDASPEVATLASLVAAGVAADRVHARVVPDGTSFEIVAPTAAIAEAAAILVQVLSARGPSDDALGSAREEIERRRLARAADVLADAEALALASLGGDEGAALLDPLARPSEPASRDAVAAFLEAHYGPSRALFVVVGDAGVVEASSAIETALRDAPGALEVAAQRSDWVASESASPRARSDVDADPSFAVAVRVATEGEAEHLAAALGERLGAGARVSLAPVPPGVLVLGSRRGALDRSTAAALARSLAMRASGAERPTVALDAAQTADLVGLAWVARAERAPEASLAVGVGVLGTGAVEQADLLAAAFDRASAGDGVPVAVREVPGDAVGVAIALLGGAAEDVPSGHGRAAIVARALRARCASDASEWVDAESIGVVRTSSRARSDAETSSLVECVLFSAIDDADLERARRDALGGLTDADVFRARVALALAPGAPGLIAPRGSLDGIAGASGLSGWLAAIRTSARARIGSTTAWNAAGRTVGLAVGREAVVASSSAAADVVFLTDPRIEVPEVIVGLRTDASAPPWVARLAASALLQQIAAGPLSIAHVEAGSALGVLWLAVGVRGPAEARDALSAQVPEWAARARDEARARLGEAIEDDARLRALEGADVASLARALSALSEASCDLDSCTAALDALFAAAPHFVVVRPEPRPRPRR